VGFVGDFAGFALHLGEEGGLFVFVFVGHGNFLFRVEK
jgi:hypothetical protein